MTTFERQQPVHLRRRLRLPPLLLREAKRAIPPSGPPKRTPTATSKPTVTARSSPPTKPSTGVPPIFWPSSRPKNWGQFWRKCLWLSHQVRTLSHLFFLYYFLIKSFWLALNANYLNGTPSVENILAVFSSMEPVSKFLEYPPKEKKVSVCPNVQLAQDLDLC